MSIATNSICFVLSVISLVFFIVALTGYTNERSSLRNVPWITGLGSANEKYYIGLRAYYYPDEFSGPGTFRDINCPFPYCATCSQNGNSALGLLLVTLLFTFIEIVVCAFSYTIAASIPGQLSQMFIALVAAVFSLSAISIFMASCYQVISLNADFDLDWGPGSIMGILGMILMWIVVFTHAIGAAYTGRGARTT